MTRFLYFVILATFIFSGTACQKKTVPQESEEPLQMQASVTQTIPFANMPSASGIEKAGTGYYVIGDDAPFLYLLDANFKPAGKFAFMDTASFASGRIPSAAKPDLESMAQFTRSDTTYLLMLGSGSATSRNVAYLVQADNPKKYKKVDVSDFYTFLKQVLARNGADQLNLEGLAINDTHAYLLQRSFGKEQSILLRFKREEFLNYITGSTAMPLASVFHFQLPKLGPYQASFSGAYLLQDKLFFTATIEGTTDAVADGEVHGSFVGYIPLLELQENKGFPVTIPVVQLDLADGKKYSGKVESLVVSQTESLGTYKAVIVSDDDKGSSDLLEVTLSGIQ